MNRIHTEIAIAAPAPTVWEIISDLDGWAAWNPVMKASGTLAAGERLHITLSAPGGKSVSFDPVVVLFEEGREFRWRSRKPFGLLDAEHGFRIVPEGSDQCSFEQFELFGGMLGRPIFSRLSRELDIGFEAMNRMLRREAEKRVRDRA